MPASSVPTYVVHKFGGSSLANAACFASVGTRLNGHQEIIVVSATSGTTSLLQETLDLAKAGQSYSGQLQTLMQAHTALISELLPVAIQSKLIITLKKDITDIEQILHALSLVGSYSKETQDIILGFGEQWSGKILAAYLAEKNRVLYLDATTVLTVRTRGNTVEVDWEKTRRDLHAFLAANSFDQLVITGFIANDHTGKRTTLGRNSSDFSGAIFAKLFNAERLIIWTDVDGIYSADPRKVPAAFPLSSLSYAEALELAYFGASVIHPQMVAPAIEANIPIDIKNSFNPDAPGTRICQQPTASPFAIRGLSSIDEVALINIEGTGMIGVCGTAARVFQCLHQAAISVILISQASSEHSICFAVLHSHAEAAAQALNETFVHEIANQQIERITADKECAILAAVGDAMVGTEGVAGQFCHALAQANVNIRAIAQGSSERNISVVVNRQQINRALRAVHAGFYLSNKTIGIGIIGHGVVGNALLQQIDTNLEHLKQTYRVNLCVRGITDSTKMILSQDPLPLTDWQHILDTQATPTDLQQFANHLRDDSMPHAVIIDCTANQTIADHYLQWMEQGINIITPNKRANSGDMAYYQQIKQITLQKNRHYLYETTVCAGLPVINTLQDLIKTGDKVHQLEGIVSGTLSYIFNELAKGHTFSQAVLKAKALGFTEPDPRDDLSGMDVARKMVCLGRELGMAVNLADIQVHDLVPPALKQCSLEQFLEQLPLHDGLMQGIVSDSQARGEKLAYVGSIEPDRGIAVSIQSYPQDHPFARLQGTDNMLIFHTERYHQQPLVIQGPGAGAQVTAAGVFADLLRLVALLG